MLSDIQVVIADTELTPFDHGTYSSRVTPYVGAAVKLAAADARRQIWKWPGECGICQPKQSGLPDGKVSAKGQPAVNIEPNSWRKRAQTEIVGVGASQSKRLWAEDASKQAKDSSAPGWPFGAQAVEVAIDRETGVIKVVRVASAHDVGRAINPLAVTSQIEGGIMMGLGYALSEALLFDGGKITNASFADYKIPTMRDIPAATPISSKKITTRSPTAPKASGEMSVFGIAPAVANAIARMTGVRIRDLPLSAEKLREQLKHRRRNKWRFRKQLSRFTKAICRGLMMT